MRQCRRGQGERDETKRGGGKTASGDFAHLRLGDHTEKKRAAYLDWAFQSEGKPPCCPPPLLLGVGESLARTKWRDSHAFCCAEQSVGYPYHTFCLCEKRTPKLKSKRREGWETGHLLPYQARYTVYGTISTLAESWADDKQEETHFRTAFGNQMQESKKLQRVPFSDLVCIPGFNPETDTMGAPSRSCGAIYDDHDHEKRCR